MATKTLISLEEYLRTSYEHDVDYVEGETIERGAPQLNHSQVQVKLVKVFARLCEERSLRLYTELRLRVAADRVRIADFCVFPEKPSEPIPSQPPLIVVEILWPDDRYAAVKRRLADFDRFGVRYIWLADPQAQQLTRYERGVMSPADNLEAAEIGFALAAAELFTD